MTEPAGYPAELERSVQLRDGAPVWIRPIRPEDAPRLVALYARLSEHTAYQRFFTVMKRLPLDWAHALAEVDYQRRLALVAEHDTRESRELIGVARYEAEDESTAEVAFVLQDDWQGKGLGSILLRDLLQAAEARGFRRFRAYVLSDNERMLRLLARHTRIAEKKTEEGVVSLIFVRSDPPAGRLHG